MKLGKTMVLLLVNGSGADHNKLLYKAFTLRIDTKTHSMLRNLIYWRLHNDPIINPFIR